MRISHLILAALFAIPAAQAEPDVFQIMNAPDLPRSDFWGPAFSFSLPGLSQWMWGQHGTAATYSTLGVVGYGLFASVRDDSSNPTDSLTDKSSANRRMLIGDALYKTGGGLSSYQAFRSAVITRRPLGEYAFLPADDVETPLDLAVAPFNLIYLTRPTTFVPLLLLMTAAVVDRGDKPWHWANFTGEDTALTASISYGAGVGEESVFRGFLLPYSQQHMATFWAANTTQAVLFGAAHYSRKNPLPWPQALLGGYFGWMARANNWKIGEGIFLHAWWDVVAIASEFATEGRIETISFPPLQLSF